MTTPDAAGRALGTTGDTFVRASASQAGTRFIDQALRQQGDRYVFGHEVEMGDVDPDVFDCSELVQWAAAQAGVEITDGSWLQYRHVRQNGGAMSVEEALNTPGALLFRFGSDPDAGGRPQGAHVAISLGDGRTIEARGSKYGVGIFDATNRSWTHAGVIPELAGATLGPPPVVEEVDPHGDSDGDGILDRYETLVGTDPFRADTDGDGFIDSVEVLDYGTSPLDAMDNPRDSVREDMGMEALGQVVQEPVPLGPVDPITYDPPGSGETVAPAAGQGEGDDDPPQPGDEENQGTGQDGPGGDGGSGGAEQNDGGGGGGDEPEPDGRRSESERAGTATNTSEEESDDVVLVEREIETTEADSSIVDEQLELDTSPHDEVSTDPDGGDSA